MQLDIIASVKEALYKKNYLVAIMLVKNYLKAKQSFETAKSFETETESYKKYDRGQSYYLDTVSSVVLRYLEDIEFAATLGFKDPSAVAPPASSPYEAMEIWLLEPKSSLGDLSADLIRHCKDVAQSLEALGLFEACDQFNLIAAQAGRPGADQAILITKAQTLFNEQVLPLIKELRAPLGVEALKQQVLSQTATLKDIETLIGVLPKGELKTALKDIQKSKKSDVVKVVLSKLAIQKYPA